MMQHDSGSPAPESFEPRPDRDSRDVSPDDGPTTKAHRDHDGKAKAAPDAPEIQKPDADAAEAIDRATAALGDDDGKR